MAPIKEVRLKQRSEPWFNGEILELIQERDRKLYEYKKTDNVNLYNEYKIIRNKTQKVIIKTKEEFYNTKIEENKNKPKKLWQDLKNLGLKSKGGGCSNIGLKIGDDVCFEKPRVAETFNNFFTNIASTLVSKLPPGTYNEKRVEDFYKSKGDPNKNFELNYVSEEDILKLLKTINVTKATGLDNLPAKFIES